MTRRTHLVGAWPGRGPEHAMELALRRLAPYLDRMTDGETGDRRLWVTAAMERFRANPDVELISDGDWSDYENVAKWRVRDGVTLDPDEPAAALRARLRATASPRSQCLREQLRPAGPALPGRHRRSHRPRHLRVRRGRVRATRRSSTPGTAAIRPRDRRDPRPRPATTSSSSSRAVVALVAVAQADDEAQPAVAGQMAATMHRHRDPALSRGRALRDPPLPRRLPPQGLRRHARRPPARAARQRDRGRVPRRTRSLEYVHAPFAAADGAADRGGVLLRAACATWTLPDDTRFIAGFLHESLDTDAHRDLLARIERLTGPGGRRGGGVRARAPRQRRGGVRADARGGGAARVAAGTHLRAIGLIGPPTAPVGGPGRPRRRTRRPTLARMALAGHTSSEVNEIAPPDTDTWAPKPAERDRRDLPAASHPALCVQQSCSANVKLEALAEICTGDCVRVSLVAVPIPVAGAVGGPSTQSRSSKHSTRIELRAAPDGRAEPASGVSHANRA